MSKDQMECLTAHLKRGAAWQCDCGAICGIFISRCWNCGYDKPISDGSPPLPFAIVEGEAPVNKAAGTSE